MDLGNLGLRAAHEVAREMPLTYHEDHGREYIGKKIGPTLLVLGKESPEVREVMLDVERANLKKGMTMADSEESRRVSVRLARVAVVGWKDWEWKGEKDVPFSTELWNTIMDDFDNFWWIAELVDRFVQRGNGFFPSPSQD